MRPAVQHTLMEGDRVYWLPNQSSGARVVEVRVNGVVVQWDSDNFKMFLEFDDDRRWDYIEAEARVYERLEIFKSTLREIE